MFDLRQIYEGGFFVMIGKKTPIHLILQRFNEVKRQGEDKIGFLSTKFSTKKFHLVSKYANYLSWDEKQNAPDN